MTQKSELTKIFFRNEHLWQVTFLYFGHMACVCPEITSIYGKPLLFPEKKSLYLS